MKRARMFMQQIALTMLMATAACEFAFEPRLNDGKFAAKVDGTRLTGITNVYGSRTGTNIYINASGIRHYAAFSVSGATGPGAYMLTGTSGNSGEYYEGPLNSHWAITGSEVAGVVIFTTLTATRATGTFQFTASPTTPSASGKRAITEGQFDVYLSESVLVEDAARPSFNR